MPSGPRDPLKTATLIHAAFPRDAAKHLERGLGCSPRQAKRIAVTGWIPATMRAAAIRLLDASIENNLSRLQELRGQLREAVFEETTHRAADRRAVLVDAGTDQDTRLAEGPGLFAVRGK